MQISREADSLRPTIFENFSPLQKYQKLKEQLSKNIEKLSVTMKNKQILSMAKLSKLGQKNVIQKASIRISLILASPMVYFNFLKSSANQQHVIHEENTVNHYSLKNEQETFMIKQQEHGSQIHSQKIIIDNSVKLFIDSLINEEKKVIAQKEKRKTEEKKRNKIKTAFDILPHLILTGLLLKGLKNIRNPKKYYQIIVGGYFWATTYPWAYFCYKGVVQYYVVPKIMSSPFLKTFQLEQTCSEQNRMASINFRI